MSKLSHSQAMDQVELQARLRENPGSTVCNQCHGRGWLEDWFVGSSKWTCPDCGGKGIVAQ